MSTRASLLAALCAAAAAAGCGSDDGPPSSQPIPAADTAETAADEQTTSAEEAQTQDKRGLALICIRDDKGIASARAVGDSSIQVGRERVDPRIDFYHHSREAEAVQFEGNAEGAEQVGAALLYVREASDAVLEELEDCLNEQ